MTFITSKVKVMQNYTICLTKDIRKQLGVKKGDSLILSIDEDGLVRVSKSYDTLDSIVGIAKDTFAALGGGEKFLKDERSSWD